MEGEVRDLPTPPEGGLKDLLPPTEGALKELPERLLLPVEGGVKDLLPPVEGILERPSNPLCWLDGLPLNRGVPLRPGFPRLLMVSPNLWFGCWKRLDCFPC